MAVTATSLEPDAPQLKLAELFNPLTWVMGA
jgi:hypothetical protein